MSFPEYNTELEDSATTTGLSLAHISPQEDQGVYVEVWEGGNLVEVVYAASESKPVAAGHNRGKVRGFSRTAKLRLLRKVSKVRTDAPAVFATLTYPAQFPTVEQAKKHVDALGKRLNRLGPYGFFWRFEYQKRGAPHFHLIVYGVKHLHRFRTWLAKTWYEICGTGLHAHLQAGTQADWVRSHKGVMHYAAKYLSKEGQKKIADPSTGEIVNTGDGRQWGVVGRKNIPWAEMARIIVSTIAGWRLGRFLGNFTEYRPLFLGRVRWFFASPDYLEIQNHAYNGCDNFSPA